MLSILLILLFAYPMYAWQKQNKNSLAIFALIPAAIAAVSGIYQAIKGAKQRRQAQAAQREAVTQQQIQANEANARAQIGMPAAQYQQALQNIQRNQANAISNLQERRLGVGAIGGVQQMGNDALLKLDAANAAARERNQQIADQQYARLINMRAGIAQQDKDYAGAVQGAGLQNIGNAATSVAVLGSNGAFGNEYDSNSGLKGLFGGNNPYNTLRKPGTRNIMDSNVSYKYNRLA